MDLFRLAYKELPCCLRVSSHDDYDYCHLALSRSLWGWSPLNLKLTTALVSLNISPFTGDSVIGFDEKRFWCRLDHHVVKCNGQVAIQELVTHG